MVLENGNNSIEKKSVCVIGAGAAGLCVLRHFTTKPYRFGPIVCYEQTDQVGGTWNYVERVGAEEANGLLVHSSMYRDLHTNLPMQIMQFPDFECSTTSKSYLHHSQVLNYLQDYAQHFNLLQHIQFEHQLKLVTRDDDSKWKVTLLNLKTSQTCTHKYDIIVLCPGRYSSPHWPPFSLMNQFTGSIIHSHDYRTREPFTGKRVAVIGGGPSGIDICLEVASVAHDVIFINRTDRQYKSLPDNVQQFKANVHQFSHNSILIKFLENNQIQEFKIDSVILATGYKLSLDFIDQDKCALRVDSSSETVTGLHRHLVNACHPSMAILAVAIGAVLPFPLYHQQILYFISIQLNKQILLTSKSESIYYLNDRHILKDANALIEYVQSLERDAGLEPLKAVTLKLYSDVLHRIQLENTLKYKAVSYRLINDEQYEQVD